MAVFTLLTCHSCSVTAVIFLLHCQGVLSWLSCLSCQTCPFLVVHPVTLFCNSCHFLTILLWTYNPYCPSLAVISLLSYHSCFIPAVLAWRSFLCCIAMALRPRLSSVIILLQLSCHGFPSWENCPDNTVLAVLQSCPPMLSCHGSPVLAVLSRLYCLACNDNDSILSLYLLHAVTAEARCRI
jgi:hypothetical protein